MSPPFLVSITQFLIYVSVKRTKISTIYLLKRARTEKDFKTEAKALDLLAKYTDLDAEDLTFDPEKFEKIIFRYHNYKIQFFLKFS